MGATVVVVTSGKGGVGKTTTAINLGVALRGQDNAVSVVDADLGMANLGTMIGVEHDTTLHDVLAGDASLSDALVEEVAGFSVVTGARELQPYADADPDALPGAVDQLREQYDYVILDGGAGLGYDDVVPVEIADEVILVTTPDPAALDDVARLRAVSAVVDARVRGLVLNRVTEETDVASIFERVDVEPLGVVPEDAALGESTAEGTPIEQYAPESPGAAAYQRLAAVLTGKEEASLSVPSPSTPRAPEESDSAGEKGEAPDATGASAETEDTPEADSEKDGSDGSGPSVDGTALEDGTETAATGEAESDAAAVSDPAETGAASPEHADPDARPEPEESASDDTADEQESGIRGFISRLF